jgi:hypothetical protein
MLCLPPHRFPTGFLGSCNRGEVNKARRTVSKPSIKMIDGVETDVIQSMIPKSGCRFSEKIMLY